MTELGNYLYKKQYSNKFLPGASLVDVFIPYFMPLGVAFPISFLSSHLRYIKNLYT